MEYKLTGLCCNGSHHLMEWDKRNCKFTKVNGALCFNFIKIMFCF